MSQLISYWRANTAKVVVSAFRFRREQDQKRRQHQSATLELPLSNPISGNKLFAALAPVRCYRLVEIALQPRSFKHSCPPVALQIKFCRAAAVYRIFTPSEPESL
eukprot:IDg22827t1